MITILVLLLGQFFAIMPVNGVSDPSASQLKFKWINIRVAYSIIMTVSFLALAVVSLMWIFVSDLSLPVIGKMCFYLFSDELWNENIFRTFRLVLHEVRWKYLFHKIR